MNKKTPKEIAIERHVKRDAAKIQQAWNERRISNLAKAVKDGYLPQESLTGLSELKQDTFNTRVSALQKAANRHAARSKKTINDIKERWAQKILVKADNKAKNEGVGNRVISVVPLTEAQKQRREEIKRQLLSEPKKKYHCPLFKIDLSLPNKSVKEWLNQPHIAYDAKNEAILDLQGNLDKCDKKIAIPVKPKHAESVKRAYALPISVDSKESWIIIHEMKWGEMKIYGISDNKLILEK